MASRVVIRIVIATEHELPGPRTALRVCLCVGPATPSRQRPTDTILLRRADPDRAGRWLGRQLHRETADRPV